VKVLCCVDKYSVACCVLGQVCWLMGRVLVSSGLCKLCRVHRTGVFDDDVF
jgi:hypothetical protein